MSRLRSWLRAHSPGGESTISRRKKDTESVMMGDVTERTGESRNFKSGAGKRKTRKRRKSVSRCDVPKSRLASRNRLWKRAERHPASWLEMKAGGGVNAGQGGS